MKLDFHLRCNIKVLEIYSNACLLSRIFNCNFCELVEKKREREMGKDYVI